MYSIHVHVVMHVHVHVALHVQWNLVTHAWDIHVTYNIGIIMSKVDLYYKA